MNKPKQRITRMNYIRRSIENIEARGIDRVTWRMIDRELREIVPSDLMSTWDAHDMQEGRRRRINNALTKIGSKSREVLEESDLEDAESQIIFPGMPVTPKRVILNDAKANAVIMKFRRLTELELVSLIRERKNQIAADQAKNGVFETIYDFCRQYFRRGAADVQECIEMAKREQDAAD